MRKAILGQADKDLVFSICEIVYNTLVGNVPLTPSQKEKLRKHKSVLVRLTRKNENWKEKKKVITSQRGGAFLPLILGILAPIISNLMFGSKK